MKPTFKTWLMACVKKPGDYTAQIERIENAYGNIDAHFDRDGCAYLLSEFIYTGEDRKNKRDYKHKIKIVPVKKDKFDSYYDGTKDLARRVNKYIEFRENEQDEELVEIAAQIKKIPARATTAKNKNNARHRGNHIGIAQNAFIRMLLSNIGVESFSEKDRNEAAQKHFGGKCAYCGAKNVKLVYDHAVPINKFKLGEHKLGNLVPACDKCNKTKGQKDFIEFAEEKNYDVAKIKEYMTKHNYTPINDGRTAKIHEILQMTHNEIGEMAKKYVTMLNEL